jgi:hypothetical protein
MAKNPAPKAAIAKNRFDQSLRFLIQRIIENPEMAKQIAAAIDQAMVSMLMVQLLKEKLTEVI